MKYFTNINTLDELKKAYRRLAMQHHPDCGGDTETMKEINAEGEVVGSHRTTKEEPKP